MQQSIAKQIYEEGILAVADKTGIDERVIEAVIRQQFSYAKKRMEFLENIRVFKLGVFKVKDKYRRMMDEFGYIQKFRGPYWKERNAILAGKTAEHIQRLEKSDLEAARDREDGKRKSKRMCVLSVS